MLSLPSSVVEPLIVFSIAYVTIENLVTSELKPCRSRPGSVVRAQETGTRSSSSCQLRSTLMYGGLPGDEWVLVEVDTSDGFRWESPERLFAGQYVVAPYTPVGIPNYDVDLDGQRFPMIKMAGSEDARRQITIVLNWFEELKARVSVS